TRTRLSFELAEKRLSADTLNFTSTNSSVKKGESFEDTVKTLSAYGLDLIVLRDQHSGAPALLRKYTDARIINAGDGKHQHPTQALLDLYTMRENFASLSGLNVAIVGDCLHSRVVGSLIPALKTVGAHPVLVGPRSFMPKYLDALDVEYLASIDEAIDSFDVIYLLRIQLERLEGALIPSLEEYAELFGMNEQRLGRMKERAI
ncbi:MAG: aspartate carbamoyltransferase, partial [Coriobacteriia bacterium]|nr:aspartate carbamoyltransferase [Coriobacteriia bacterium]